jgi:hypothetical protein
MFVEKCGHFGSIDGTKHDRLGASDVLRYRSRIILKRCLQALIMLLRAQCLLGLPALTASHVDEKSVFFFGQGVDVTVLHSRSTFTNDWLLKTL